MTGKEIIEQYENQEPIQNNKGFKTLAEIIDEQILGYVDIVEDGIAVENLPIVNYLIRSILRLC
jgi:hypothetical protein